MYGMLSGGHHHHHQNHHRTVHGVSMFQQQQQQPPPLLNNNSSSNNNNNNNNSSIFFKPCFNKAPPCSSSSLIWAESNNNNNNFEALEFSSSPANLIGSSSEPTSVLDLRSPSPNNSRALSASSSSSSDCNNRNTGNIVDASSSSHHHQQHQQAKVKSTTIHQVNHHNSNSSPGGGGGDEHELQDELQQAVAGVGVGYGVLPLFYSAQGIRPVENLESSGGDQWSLLQDVLGSHQELQQQQQNSKQKYEELESELLSSSSPACAHQENSSSTSFMRWFLEEPGVPAPEIDGLLPPWQHQQQLQQPQQQHQMMMMVKQEEQQQQLQPPSSSLHPHLAHLESFTRRTLPLVSSSHDVFHQQPVQFQEQSPFSGMNLLWQQQQQPQHQGFQQSFQIHHQQQQREPFLLGMLQDDPHQHIFGGPASSLASLPRPPPFLMENLASQQHHHLPHHLQVRDLKQQQRMPPRSPDMNNNTIHIKRELPGGYFEPSNKMARTSTSVSSPGHPGHPVAPPQRGGGGAGGGGSTEDINWCSSSGAFFVSRLLLRAAEACESGNREHAQSILARLNDHHQHHHTQLLLQQQQQQQKKPGGATLVHLSPAQRIGFIFRDILSDRLSRTSSNRLEAGASSSSGASSTSSSSGANPTPNPTQSPVAPAEIVERVQACKSLCDDSKLLRFAHFVANQAISEALEGEESVHILDLSEAGSSPASNSYFGGQWSSFVASVIRQKTPKPMRIRITLAGTREHALCFAISSLKELAREYHSSTTVSGPEFEFHGVLTRPGYPVSLSEMGVHPEEPLIVNLVLGLHKLVPASEVLRSIRACNPKLVLLVEQELEVKSSFVGRFRDGLEHHTSVAESVSCEDWTREDSERVERLVWRPEIEALLSGSLEHQRLENWRLRMAQAGFGNSKMSEMCDKLAQSLFSLDKNGSSSSSSNNNTTTTSGNRGLFEILNDDGSLMLSFKGKHLASASAWKPCG